MTKTLFKLSPSDLTFLWDECKRCFYLKIVHRFNRPATPMPAIFNQIDRLMKDFSQGKSTLELCPDLPQGVIQHRDRWVQSQLIELPGRAARCYLSGRFDSIARFEDHTYGVVDFKTSTPKPAHVSFYGRQLHAYAYALENPAPGKFGLSPITRLGLLVVEPQAVARTPEGQIAYLGTMTWQEIPRDDRAFLAFLDEVLAVLEQPAPPEANEKCGWCRYRTAAQANRL
jgi:hypothetical protein